jgi:hypothetical protein
MPQSVEHTLYLTSQMDLGIEEKDCITSMTNLITYVSLKVTLNPKLKGKHCNDNTLLNLKDGKQNGLTQCCPIFYTPKK